MTKYNVYKEYNSGKIIERYEDMNYEELFEFLLPFVGDGTRNGYCYDDIKDLEGDLEYIKEYGEETLLVWYDSRIQIREIKEDK